MIEKLDLIKEDGNILCSDNTLTNLRIIEKKINEIIEYINKENPGEVVYKELINTIFPGTK